MFYYNFCCTYDAISNIIMIKVCITAIQNIFKLGSPAWFGCYIAILSILQEYTIQEYVYDQMI